MHALPASWCYSAADVGNSGYNSAMCDHWMPFLKLPLTLEQFHQLPRNAAYKYEYIGGEAWLTPRAKVYHARLDLASWRGPADLDAPAGLTLRRVRRRDLDPLVPVFGAAFHRIQPFGSLDDATLDQAARAALTKTWTGGDGPWVRFASYAAMLENRLVGACLITLVREVDPSGWDDLEWPQPPPADLLKQRRGQPHLTWIFTAPRRKGAGIGSALLAASVNVLRRLGYSSLLSTFFSANESSLLWHWRNGFALLPHCGSQRHWREVADSTR